MLSPHLKRVFLPIWSMVLVNLLTGILGSVGVLMSVIGFRSDTIHRTIIRRWARWALVLSGIRVHVTGLDRIDPPDGPFVVVMNHQSLLDVPVIIASLPLQLRLIGKVELSKIPIFGAIARRGGHFFLDRRDHENSVSALKAAASEVLDRKVSLVIAPEGTRSTDGMLLPFKKGAFVIAITMGLNVLPVIIRGTRDALPKGRLGSIGGNVYLTVEEPVSTAGMSYDDRDRLMELVWGRMERHLSFEV